MEFTNRPTLLPDGSVPGEFYDESYWEKGAESGKGSYNGNDYVNNVAACKIWAMDCYNRWGPFESFLELGCGRGWNIYGFLHMPELGVEKLLGVDISKYAIETTPEIVRPHLIYGDISKLGAIANQSFDTVFSNDVLEHLTSLQAYECLLECRRIAKKHVAHLISIGDGVNVPEGLVPSDQDQSHINLKSIAWWLNLFGKAFVYREDSEWVIHIIEHGRTVEIHMERRHWPED